jgi:cytochrome c oxidase subunit 1
MYPPEFQFFNIMSSGGAAVLGIGYLLPMLYFTWSFFKGAAAGPNPWKATGLEWTTQSPPLPENFPDTPVVTEGAYEYSKREIKVA